MGPEANYTDSPEFGLLQIESYFYWLCDEAYIYDLHSNKQEFSYWGLATILYDIPFTWFVPNDDNRLEDAYLLREDWEDQTGGAPEYLNDVSVLEVIYGIAKRFNFLVGGKASEIHHRFWELLHNLGLDIYEDSVDYNRQEVRDIIHVFLNRTYSFDGTGGIFPLRNPEKDQRTVEIWYQMNNYVEENYMLTDEIL